MTLSVTDIYPNDKYSCISSIYVPCTVGLAYMRRSNAINRLWAVSLKVQYRRLVIRS